MHNQGRPVTCNPTKTRAIFNGTNYKWVSKPGNYNVHDSYMHMPYLISFGKRTASILDKRFPLALLLATKTQCNALSELARSPDRLPRLLNAIPIAN